MRCTVAILAVLALAASADDCAATAADCAATGGAARCISHFNGGRTVPVHRLPALDAEGDAVSPRGRLPRAISLERTCAQCHDVAAMRGGSHFRTGAAGDAENRANLEPWFLRGTNGSCRAVSLADRGGLTAWEWTKTFAWAFPGGGLASDTNAMSEAAGARQRWFVTGPLEMNCLACHQTDGLYDRSEWARQTLRENWRGAALAASGLAQVEGMNERLDASWDDFVRENPDDHLFKVPERIRYESSRHDDRGRFLFPVGRPKAENCLACHAAAEADAQRNSIGGDVHLRRGMTCTDCHGNGMDHRMETKSCASCHLEPGGAGPRPRHAGFPSVHFTKLDCATCHSGVTAHGRRAQVRTARSNRIGIYGRAQWATDVPFIEEPFFRKDADGRVRIWRRARTDGGETYWPFAHDVRPARQARGAAPERCAACHAPGSEFFEGWENPVYFTAFNLAFLGRPLFKIFLWAAFACLVLFTAGAAAAALGGLKTRRNAFTASR